MIPKHALDRLKCALCDNSLSIFPIHSYGNKDIVTCGRCSLQKDFLPQREHLYEEVARYIEFPCRYEQNGCIEKLRPADMQSHESSCLHKTCLCPILPLGQCKWQGPYSDLYQHCLDTHPIFTFKDFRIELDIVNAHDENYVFYQADKTFIAQIKSDPMNKKFYCNVICCDDESKTKEFSYRVRFVNDKTEFKCDKNEVDFSNISQFSVTDKTTSIDISNLISQLNNPSCVICKIDITDNSKISESKVTLLEDNSEILKALECPICFSCLSTPILQCNTGHSYCGSHRDQLIVCPICESDVEETRNYALEEIAHIIECPCTHQEFGCSYSATAKNIKEHESTCAHKPYRCFISSCNWESSLSNLKEHFIQQHKDIVVELNSVTYVLDEDEREKHEELVLFSHDKIFKLIFEQSSEGFIWSLQVIGDKSSSSKYMLELDFTSQWKEKIFIRKQCCSVDEFPEYDEDLFVELSFRQLKSKFSGTCKWNGEYRDLSVHCQHTHPNFIFENFLIEVDIINSSEDNYVFCQANETFVAQLKVDTRGHNVYCNVRYCGLDSAAKQFSYRLCFLGNKKKYACQVHSVQAGEVGPILTENTTIADFENILENLHFPVCITCRVDIFVKKLPKEEHEEIATSSEGNSILKKLECPICLDYMVPPIMQCSVGHSFCQWCRNQLTECPTCKSPISATRNYLLEDITTIINYPCKYARFGCKFSGNAQNIKDHEATCENGPYKCIIENCPWEGRHSKLIAHLNETHKDNILETDVVTHIIDDELDRESYDYIIIIKDDVFKIEFVRDCFEFTWTLSSVNKTKYCSNFVLLMDFNSEFNERLYMRKRLHPLFLRLDRLQLENFIEDNILSYKIQLIESE